MWLACSKSPTPSTLRDTIKKERVPRENGIRPIALLIPSYVLPASYSQPTPLSPKPEPPLLPLALAPFLPGNVPG